MEQSARDTWKLLLDQARQRLPEQTVRTWLDPVEAIGLEDGRLVLGAPDQFAAEWNESKHAAFLSELSGHANGRPLAVTFRVAEDQARRPQMDFFVPPPTSAAQAAAAGGIPDWAQPLNNRYTFARFVVGKSNEMAAAAAHAVAMAPGKTYNPLFIYGPTGLGKTHLMQAIAHVILERQTEMRTVYISGEQFINDVVAGIQSRTMPQFHRRYRNDLDLILVDDVHFLEGKETTQEEFFHTFNALHEAGKQIVLTSDRPPKAIPGLEARLVSRFEWGMVVDIGQPDLEHRTAILRKKAEQDHLDMTIPDDVIRFIAEHVRSSVRELEGCIIKLLLFASLKHREITVELARDALSDKIQAAVDGDAGRRSPPSINRVQEVVARRWGVTPEGLQSKARTKRLTVPRQIAMYLARKLTSASFPDIGEKIGGRDHSTVIYANNKIKKNLESNPKLKQVIEEIEETLLHKH